MSLKELLHEIGDSYTPSLPVYTVNMGRNAKWIRFVITDYITTNSDKEICHKLQKTIQQVRQHDGTHVIDMAHLGHQVEIEIIESLADFLSKHLNVKFPKRTAIYRWYSFTTKRLMNDESFGDDMAELYKYLFYRTEKISDIDIQNGIGLLKLLYNKYKV